MEEAPIGWCWWWLFQYDRENPHFCPHQIIKQYHPFSSSRRRKRRSCKSIDKQDFKPRLTHNLRKCLQHVTNTNSTCELVYRLCGYDYYYNMKRYFDMVARRCGTLDYSTYYWPISSNVTTFVTTYNHHCLRLCVVLISLYDVSTPTVSIILFL